MTATIRKFSGADLPEMIDIWNSIVEQGMAFPQTENLDIDTASTFFGEQTFTGVADNGSEIAGLYILHPNNTGRCGHISNASYAVKPGQRGKGIGEMLVRHSMTQAKMNGFRILQFNAVVANNTAALELYAKFGFTRLGTIPGGFLSTNGEYLDIIPHYIDLLQN